MKIIKFLFAALIFCAFTNVASAQFNPEAKAKEIVEELNNYILKGNPNAGMSEEQKESITILHTERMKEMMAFRKTKPTEDAIKEKALKLNKAVAAKTFKEILTKEQVKANLDGRKNNSSAKATAEAKVEKPKPVVEAKPKPVVKESLTKEKTTPNARVTAKAKELTEDMNSRIKSMNPEAALNEFQLKKIEMLYNDKITNFIKLKQSGATEDEIAKYNKTTMKNILDVLTPEQRKARGQSYQAERGK